MLAIGFLLFIVLTSIHGQLTLHSGKWVQVGTKDLPSEWFESLLKFLEEQDHHFLRFLAARRFTPFRPYQLLAVNAGILLLAVVFLALLGYLRLANRIFKKQIKPIELSPTPHPRLDQIYEILQNPKNTDKTFGELLVDEDIDLKPYDAHVEGFPCDFSNEATNDQKLRGKVPRYSLQKGSPPKNNDNA